MSKVREESSNTIMNELVPTLDCIFGNYGKGFVNLQKLVNDNTKDEDIIGLRNFDGDDKNIINIIEASYTNNLDSLIYTDINGFKFGKFNRKEVENFSNVKQMVTSAIIRDKEHILLLSNLKPNAFYPRATLSMIQGHVEYPEDLNITLTDIFRMNMAKELNEEINSRNYDFGGFGIDKPIGIIYLPVAPSTNKHCCILYEIEVDNVDDFYCNELDKHSLIKLRIDQIHTQYNYLCPWVLQGLKFSRHIKKTYFEYIGTLNI